MMPNPADIMKMFGLHEKDDYREKKALECIREESKKIAWFFNEICPESKELSIALTKLEEAMFWASACITRNGLAKPE